MVSRKALEIICQISCEIKDREDIKKFIKEDVEWYKRSILQSNVFTLFFKDYMKLNYESMIFLSSKNGTTDSEIISFKLRNRVTKVLNELKEAEENFGKQDYKPADYLGGSLAMQKEALNYLEINLKDIEKSLEIGKVFVSKHEYRNWW